MATDVTPPIVRTRPPLRAFARGRGPGLLIGAGLMVLGFHPAPLWLLMSDPAWRSDLAVRQFRSEADYWMSGILLVIGPALALGAMLAPQLDRGSRAARDALARVRPLHFAIALALFAAVAAAAFCVYALAAKPTTSDEIAQLWHAKILLSGRLTLPGDPNPEFFAVDNIIDQGRWYSQFPIGGPASLAVGMALHATWLLNPILAGLTVINVARFAERVFGPSESRVAALLCATCPFIAMMSGSYMNHTAVACLATLALQQAPVCVASSGRARLRAAAVIGLSLGAAIAIRPLDGAVAALTVGFCLIYDIRTISWTALATTTLAGAVPVALLLTANALTTGHPLEFGYQVLWGPNHSLGFHADPTGNLHTPARGLALAVLYLVQLNWSLFDWPIPGVLIVAAIVVVIGKPRRWEAALLLWVFLQLVAYASYWHAGSFFGPRYLFTIVPALLILTARGIVIVDREASAAVRRGLFVSVAASILATWLIPTSPVGALGKALAARASRPSFKMNLDQVIASASQAKTLVFVRETASLRLSRRLWGLGISRPDAARLIATKDNCALLDEAIEEAVRTEPVNMRLSRLEQVKAYSPPPGLKLQMPDPAFRVSDRESVTPRCDAELHADVEHGETVAYGQAFLLNEIDHAGRISGPAIFVADIGEHNDVLRGRFSDRAWYRLEMPAGGAGEPQLVPYR